MEKERKVFLAATTTTKALNSGIISRGEDRVSSVERSMEKLISEFLELRVQLLEWILLNDRILFKNIIT